MQLKILLVCTGNTCRSSMAQGIAQKILAEMGQAEKVTISSAGTMAWPGYGAEPKAIQVLAAKGIDLTSHQTTKLTSPLILESDIIIAMTESHRQQILAMVNNYAGRIYVLNVSDPFGGSIEDYEICANQISQHLQQLLPQLVVELNK